MKHFLKLIPILLCFQIGFAQYTKVINSRRPGFSDSPYSVGTKVYQVEAGLYYKDVGNYLYWDSNDVKYEYGSEAFGTDITFRTGQFFEKLEFNVDLALQNENRAYTSPADSTASAFGLSKFTVGAKYLVYMPKYKDKSKEIHSWKERHKYDTRRLIPAVGVYAGLNTNLLDNMHKNPDGISPRFAIFTQNDLTNRLILLTNFIADKAFTEEAENSYIITVTYAFNEKLSIFGENQGFMRKNVPNDFQFGAGMAYLINPNIQVDFSARMIYDERTDSSYLFGTGMSWRLDKHRDKVIAKKTNNDEPSLEMAKKGFFAGLFAGGIFVSKNKNNKKMKEVKTSKAKTRSLEPPVNKKAQKLQKKKDKHLIKQQKQKEKAERKYYKKQEKE